MPKQLYNEGRVVGYSAYELYVKHALTENPEIEPATEREWLAAQIGHGTSMILKVSTHNTSGIHFVDYELPSNSALCTANTIIASQFFGTCKWDGNWATKIIDYGQGISNTSSSSPSDSTSAKSYPKQSATHFSRTDFEITTSSDSSVKNSTASPNFLQYIKIQDGWVLQPGAWKVTTHQSPYKDFTANMHKVPTVRLVFVGPITKEFYILLTGFTNRSILSGIVADDLGSTSELKPENGDFIGPELYPWANKIIFMQSPITTYSLRHGIAEHSMPSSIPAHNHPSWIKPVGWTSDELNWANAETESDKLSTSQIDQSNLKITHPDDSSDTIFKVSDLHPGRGIAIQPPSEAAGNIQISSIVSVNTDTVRNEQNQLVQKNKYLKVFQQPGTTVKQSTTNLNVSTLTAVKGIKIDQPNVDAGDIGLSAPIIAGYAMIVNQTQYNSTVAVNEDGLLKIWAEINSLKSRVSALEGSVSSLSTEITNVKNSIPEDPTEKINALWRAINNIIRKVVGNGSNSANKNNTTIADAITWNSPADDGKIAIGNLNIHTSSAGNSTYDKHIYTHTGTNAGDVRLQ